MEKRKNALIRFLGGKTSYYVIGLVCLLCIMVLLLRQVDFLFMPLGVIIQTVLPPFIFALILYYVFDPLVDLLAKKNISRGLSIAVIYLILVALLVLGSIQLFPMIQQQAIDLFQQLPQLFENFQHSLQGTLDNTPFAESFDKALESIDAITADLTSFVNDNWQDGLKGLSNVFSAVSTIGITLFTGPIIAFFLIKSPRKFYFHLMEIVPPRFRRDTHELLATADSQIGAYLKGQVIASLLLGGIYWVVFLLIGLKYATVIALAAGLLNIVPYIGAFVAFLPGLFVAFQDSTFMGIKFIIAWFVVQLLHGDLVVPRVMGDRMKIHPITILIVLLVMGDLLGVVGVIFGIPIYALLKVVVVFIFRKFKRRYNEYFPDDGKYRQTEFKKDNYLD